MAAIVTFAKYVRYRDRELIHEGRHFTCNTADKIAEIRVLPIAHHDRI